MVVQVVSYDWYNHNLQRQFTKGTITIKYQIQYLIENFGSSGINLTKQ